MRGFPVIITRFVNGNILSLSDPNRLKTLLFGKGFNLFINIQIEITLN